MQRVDSMHSRGVFLKRSALKRAPTNAEHMVVRENHESGFFPSSKHVGTTSMRGFVANTDYEWFTFLRSIEPPIDEVNFWRPGSESSFKALQPGEPFFFKLKAPRNAIGGFGYFAHYSSLPVPWPGTYIARPTALPRIERCANGS